MRESKAIEVLKDYVESTKNQHYSGKAGPIDLIMQRPDKGVEFCLGNIIKYAYRFGKKGDEKDRKNDVLKILHYGLLLLTSIEDEENVR